MARLKPEGKTEIAKSLVQIAAMMRHRSLIMMFSDLLADPDPVIQALRRIRHGGHDVILFHILDEAEVRFPFDGIVEFEEPEAQRPQCKSTQPTFGRPIWTNSRNLFGSATSRECFQIGVDYVPLDTSMQFDKALMEYLVNRRGRF